MWPFRFERKDRRSGRVAFLIECLLNQNARDMGAAESPAIARPVIERLARRDVGMVQIPCPEIACLDFPRRRAPGQSIRDALRPRSRPPAVNDWRWRQRIRSSATWSRVSRL